MFNRYWRSYPWFLQMALFIIMMFTLVSFATYVALLLVPKISGVSYANLMHLTPASPLRDIRANLISQGIEHVGMFLLPAVLFAVFSHPDARSYLGLRLPGKPVHWLLVTGIMLGLIPLFLWGESWMMRHMQLGKTADDIQKAGDEAIATYLRLNTPADLALLLLVLALLPALGEELFFRGVMLRLLHRALLRPSGD